MVCVLRGRYISHVHLGFWGARMSFPNRASVSATYKVFEPMFAAPHLASPGVQLHWVLWYDILISDLSWDGWNLLGGSLSKLATEFRCHLESVVINRSKLGTSRKLRKAQTCFDLWCFTHFFVC